jgi:hypothetical protein
LIQESGLKINIWVSCTENSKEPVVIYISQSSPEETEPTEERWMIDK